MAINEIAVRQNQERFLTYLAAQRQLYDEEKRRSTWWTAGVLAVALLASGGLALGTPWAPLVTLISVLIVMGEMWALPFFLEPRHKAAKIQEQFDSELFELPWNAALGRPAEEAVILDAVARFRRQRRPGEWDKLKDWYTTPTLGDLSLSRARLTCQRENIWWESKQRRAYSGWVTAGVLGLFIALLIVGVLLNWGLQGFFGAPVLLALPVLQTAVRQMYEHRQAAERMDELLRLVDDLLEDAAAGTKTDDELTKRSRELQTEIYHHRSETTPVFSWFYGALHGKLQRLLTSKLPK